MRPVCVICTEIFVINSQITACPCGHVFHEECIFRWLRSGQQNCPQCRAKCTVSSVIKRLYLTEGELSCTQESGGSGADVDGNSAHDVRAALLADKEGNGAVLAAKYEDLLGRVQEYKSMLREKNDSVTAKQRIIDQKDTKIKELEDSSVGTRKKLAEDQMLIDYLKKELENYNNLKEQLATREKLVFQLDNKLKEFKSIEMIYKDHEGAFENEMRKYMSSTTTLSNCHAVIRQLVSTNVLCKEQLDKQTEEKKLIRKKLFQMEKHQSDKERFIASKEQAFAALTERALRAERELQARTVQFNTLRAKLTAIGSSNSATSAASAVADTVLTPQATEGCKRRDYDSEQESDAEMLVNDTLSPRIESPAIVGKQQTTVRYAAASRFRLASSGDDEMLPRLSSGDDDSDIQFLDEIGEIESKYAAQRQLADNGPVTVGSSSSCTSVISSTSTDDEQNNNNDVSLKKRKNPFSKSESFPTIDTLASGVDHGAALKLPTNSNSSSGANNRISYSQYANESPDITWVKPVTVMKKNKSETMAMTNSSSSSSSAVVRGNTGNSHNSGRSTFASYFSYQYDGLGGRTKVFKSNNKTDVATAPSSKSSGSSSSTSSSSTSKLSRFKVT